MTRQFKEATYEGCFQATRALCNVCGTLTDAKVIFRDEKVYLAKWCPDHGLTEALISSDVGWYLGSQSFVKAGTEPRKRAVSDFTGCPGSCGLCPRHEQHTCLPIIEITGDCNLSCPICLVDRERQAPLTGDQFKGIVDGLIEAEPQLNMINLSGGEPTEHPEFLKFIDYVNSRAEVGLVSVSTNGLTLLENKSMLTTLAEKDVVVALQLDGFEPDTYQTLRGRSDLAVKKRQLIESMLEIGNKMSFTVTLARGVNEHELPNILELLFQHDKVLSIMVQPLAYMPGNIGGPAHDPLDVITIPDCVKLLAASSGGVLAAEDFTPLPCSHPSCFALTYLLKTKSGDLVSLPSVVDMDSYLDVIKNQALLGTDTDTLVKLRDALYSLWSASNQIPSQEAVLKTVRQILLDLNAMGHGASHRSVIGLGLTHVKSIFIHSFMDRFTFDLTRAIKCCNHYPQTDGRLLPACVRNNLPL